MIQVRIPVEIQWVDDDGNPVSWEEIAALIPTNPAWGETDEDGDSDETG